MKIMANIDNRSDSPTSSLLYRSVSHETKQKFDKLLKNALHQNDKVNKDTKNLKRVQATKIKEKNKNPSSNDVNDNSSNKSKDSKKSVKLNKKEPETITNLDEDEPTPRPKILENNHRDNFILEKFLSDAVRVKKNRLLIDAKNPEKNQKHNNSVTFIKPPVPLPRKEKINEIKNIENSSDDSSCRTYSIASPKIVDSKLLNNLEKLNPKNAENSKVFNFKIEHERKKAQPIQQKINSDKLKQPKDAYSHKRESNLEPSKSDNKNKISEENQKNPSNFKQVKTKKNCFYSPERIISLEAENPDDLISNPGHKPETVNDYSKFTSPLKNSDQFQNDNENSSASSNETYKVKVSKIGENSLPKRPKNKNISSSNSEVVSEPTPIGDILIHSSPKSKSFVVKQNREKSPKIEDLSEFSDDSPTRKSFAPKNAKVSQKNFEKISKIDSSSEISDVSRVKHSTTGVILGKKEKNFSPKTQNSSKTIVYALSKKKSTEIIWDKKKDHNSDSSTEKSPSKSKRASKNTKNFKYEQKSLPKEDKVLNLAAKKLKTLAKYEAIELEECKGGKFKNPSKSEAANEAETKFDEKYGNTKLRNLKHKKLKNGQRIQDSEETNEDEVKFDEKYRNPEDISKREATKVRSMKHQKLKNGQKNEDSEETNEAEVKFDEKYKNAEDISKRKATKVRSMKHKKLKNGQRNVDSEETNEDEIKFDEKYRNLENPNDPCDENDPQHDLQDPDDDINHDVQEINDPTVKVNKKKQKRVPEEKVYTYEDLIGIIIYKTDQLLLNTLITHPLVKIHLVDCSTGQYLKRSDDFTDVYKDFQHTEYVGPQITKTHNLQENRNLVPIWEELVVFKEDFDYMLEYKNSVIIFFEILNFLSFSAASLGYKKEGTNSGWHKVAWAFLKPVGKDGHLNTDQKIRLQLYKPKNYSNKRSPRECIIYSWYKNEKWDKYPSTLHVNVKRVKASETLKKQQETTKPFTNKNLDNLTSNDFEFLTNQNQNGGSDQKFDSSNETITYKWSRIYSQSCKIPNKIVDRLNTGQKGCLIVKFSNNGLYLAYGVSNENDFPIIIYSVLNKKEFCKFSGHQGLIYDLLWSENDKFLVSASQDCTVYIWDVEHKNFLPKQVLPHPTYVYCTKLNFKKSEIITGCFDQLIRVWKSIGSIISDYELMQELEGHLGYVTSLCYAKNMKKFYSSDSTGVIIEWAFTKKEWSLNRTLQFRELNNTVINDIILHPGSNRMLIFCRDSIHRMIDLEVGCIIQWYKGSINYRLQLTSCVSPCGSLIFSPSEDGTICIWNTDTGKLLATYIPYTNEIEAVLPHCIQYHPLEHMVAIAHHGTNLPILLCGYQQNSLGTELSLKEFVEVKGKENLEDKSSVEIKSRDIPEIGRLARGKSVNLDTILEKIEGVLENARNE